MLSHAATLVENFVPESAAIPEHHLVTTPLIPMKAASYVLALENQDIYATVFPSIDMVANGNTTRVIPISYEVPDDLDAFHTDYAAILKRAKEEMIDD